MTSLPLSLPAGLLALTAIIAGMLPIALGRGEGAGTRAAMAVTIIGGQAICLLLTLLVAPVVNTCFDDLRDWRAARPAGLFRRSAPDTGVARSHDQSAV